MKTRRANVKRTICHVVIGGEIRQYIRTLKRHRYSPRTIDIYRRALLDMDSFLVSQGVCRAGDVTAANLSDYRVSLIERGFKTASVSVYIRAVRGLFRQLEAQRKIFINPATGLIVRNPRQQIQRVPTVQEVRALLEAPDTSSGYGLRDRAILETAYATGARRAELASINLPSLDLTGRTVRLMGKGGRERIVPLTVSAATWLSRYINEGRRQFPSHDSDSLWLGQSGPLTPNGITYVFVRYSEMAGIVPVIRPHAIRRACATHMLRNGAGPVEIQQLLGHACLKHLSQYLAVTITEIMSAHEHSKLGQ